MFKSKKGFTLVELLAVLLVLTIIVLIAVNIINDKVKEAKKNTVEVNANNYVKAINGVASLTQNTDDDMESGSYDVKVLNKTSIKVSGDKPKRGYLILENYEVKYGCLRYDDYSAIIVNGKTDSIGKDNCLKNLFYAEFDSTRSQEQFTALAEGFYHVEVWGAQGGNYTESLIGGYGAYSSGYVYLNKGDKLYINVGSQGDGYEGYSRSVYSGGYNGGGYSYERNGGVNPMAGGGATSIAFKSGTLDSLSDYKGTLDSVNNVYRSDQILIVAGGGAGAYGYGSYSGKSGGGYIGGYADDSSLAGSQTSGVYFGKGSDYSSDSSSNHAGGGGGFYGGTAYWDGKAGGGSGYIASTRLFDGVMYCYGCSESSNNLTKTISTSCAESNQTENCAKKGNGYAKITLSTNYEYGDSVFDFKYVNGEEKYIVTKTGKYKLEVWGAQGGSANGYVGGYGAYSVGEINLTKGTKLYINVGGQGISSSETEFIPGGYNGGGKAHAGECNGTTTNRWGASGGGATSIAKVSGQLKNLDENKDKGNILIVAGGGGGSFNTINWYFGDGGSGGGSVGVSGYSYRTDTGFMSYPTGGTQTSGGIGGSNYAQTSILPVMAGGFGYAGSAPDWETCNVGGAGGGGFYGGGSGNDASGGGGSGYIGNSLLTNKAMYCYNCTQDTNTDTYTNKVSEAFDDPTPSKAKKGNGYARITFIE